MDNNIKTSSGESSGNMIVSDLTQSSLINSGATVKVSYNLNRENSSVN